MRRTPALIVGGGPAGAAVALHLARAGTTHLLVERNVTPTDPLCGGFLSWRTLAALERIGVERETLNHTAITQVRLYAGQRSASAMLPHAALAVSRQRLDTVLQRAARDAGAAIETGVTVRHASPGVVTLTDGAEIACDALFLASGKHDVRGLARPAEARGRDPALGLRVRLGPAPALDTMLKGAIELHLFDRGYAGCALQEDGSVNLCMAVHRSRLQESGDPEALLAALAAESSRLGERLAYRASGAAIDAVANVPYGWRARHGIAGLFRLGDQAGVIPSLAGEGIGIALASAERAARRYVRGGDAAAPAFQRDLAGALVRPLAIAGLVRDAAERPAMAARLLLVARLAPAFVGWAARLTRIK